MERLRRRIAKYTSARKARQPKRRLVPEEDLARQAEADAERSVGLVEPPKAPEIKPTDDVEFAPDVMPWEELISNG